MKNPLFYIIVLIVSIIIYIDTAIAKDNIIIENSNERPENVRELAELLGCYSQGVDFLLSDVWENAKDMVKSDTTIENSFTVHFIIEEAGFIGIGLKAKIQCDSGFTKKYPHLKVEDKIKLISLPYMRELAKLDIDFADNCKKNAKDDSLKSVVLAACESHKKNLVEVRKKVLSE